MQSRVCRLPKPDKQGRIRACVGYMKDGKQPRFTVGDKRVSLMEAERRLNTIRLLYDCQCKRYGGSIWIAWCYNVAVGVSKRGFATDVCLGAGINMKQRAANVQMLKEWRIPVELEQPKIHSQGLSLLNDGMIEQLQALIAQQQKVQGIKFSTPENILSLGDSTTMHEAIEEMKEYIRQTGTKNEMGVLEGFPEQQINRLGWLKDHHQDMPLYKLQEYNSLNRIIGYWRNRPPTKKTERCSKYYARDMINELYRFLRWLNNSDDFNFELPKNFEQINRKIIDLKSEGNDEPFQTIIKPAYSPEELAIIFNYLDDYEKAIVALCVNCAFGAAEVGQQPCRLIQLNVKHPHNKNLMGYESSANDSWVTGKRPKSKCYGEHLLWPKVAKAIKPFLDGREVLPIKPDGEPWYDIRKGAAAGDKFTDWWKKKIKKVRKAHPKLQKLPFGSLRDVLPNYLRQLYSESVASVALQHKTPSDDKLLQCYSNYPFGQLFKATQELEETFKPMLDQLS